MHDVLDLRDLVPDEVEQLAHSGYQVGTLGFEAKQAADRGDLKELERIDAELSHAERRPGWRYEEPDEPETLLSAIEALKPSPCEETQLERRIRGGWLGRTVGNTMGKPVEGLTRENVAIYLKSVGQWPQTGFIPLSDTLPTGVSALHWSAPQAAAGAFSDVPQDDDIDWTILALHLIEQHGRDLTPDLIAEAWLDLLPFTQTYTAERAAYRNLVRGIRPPLTASQDNPYREWIGALIRADAFGYVNPGDPAAAARLALVDARLSHVANGIYGEMWAAALVATAFTADSSRSALEAALPIVPQGSRLAEALRHVIALHDEGADRLSALDWVDDKLGHYNWVHTINNAALISIGLLWGSDFVDAVGTAIAGGRDTDSTAATVGSVYGILHGSEAIPERLVGNTHVHVRSAVRGFDRITIDELTERTLKLVVRRGGGQ